MIYVFALVQYWLNDDNAATTFNYNNNDNKDVFSNVSKEDIKSKTSMSGRL